jgi:hypothetical protein
MIFEISEFYAFIVGLGYKFEILSGLFRRGFLLDSGCYFFCTFFITSSLLSFLVQKNQS